MLDLMKASVTNGTGQNAQTRTYFFRSKEDTYAEIGDIVGITEAEDTEEDEPAYKVEELQAKGILFRLSCTLENGKVRQVLCTRDKLSSALDNLESTGSISGQEIESVVISRKAKFF